MKIFHMIHAALGLVLLLVFVVAESDDFQVEVYSLSYQTAESVLPALSAALQPNESVSNHNNQLVVNALPSSQKKVMELIKQLDQAPRNLMISVRNRRDSESADQDIAVSGSIKTGTVTVGSPASATASRSQQQTGLAVVSAREQRHELARSEQTIRAVEGHPARIGTGQKAMYHTPDIHGNPTTHFVSADQGFYITARIMGDRVLLNVKTSNDSFSPTQTGVVDTEQLEANVSGAVGEWIDLGNISTQTDSGSSHTSQTSATRFRLSDISVRVVPLQ